MSTGQGSTVTTTLVVSDKLTAPAQKAVASVVQGAEKMKTSLGGLQLKFSTFSKIATGAIAYFSAQALEKMVQVNKQMKDLAVSYDYLQAAALAGKKAPEEMSRLFTQLGQTMTEARLGSLRSAEALGALGISAQVIASGNVQTAFREMVDSLSKVSDPAERGAAAMRLLGEDGARTLEEIISNSGGIAKMREELGRLGVAITPEAIERSKKAEEAINKLKTSVSALGSTIASDVAPTVTKFFDHFLVGWRLINEGSQSGFARTLGKMGVERLPAPPSNSGGAAGVGMGGNRNVLSAFLEQYATQGVGPALEFQQRFSGQRNVMGLFSSAGSQAFHDFLNRKSYEMREDNPLSRYNRALGTPMEQSYLRRRAPDVWRRMKTEARESELGISATPQENEKFRLGMQSLQTALQQGTITANQFQRGLLNLAKEINAIILPMEEWAIEAQNIVESGRALGRTQEQIEIQLRKGREGKTGEWLTEDAQVKMAWRMRELQEQYGQGQFGAVGSAGAQRELDWRRRMARNQVFGVGMLPGEELSFRQRQLMPLMSSGIGEEREMGFRMFKEAVYKFQESVRDISRAKFGLTGPNAGLLTEKERLDREMRAIQDQAAGGAFGPPGSKEAQELQRRAIFQAFEQHGIQPRLYKASFEGIGDTWKRIQAEKMGRGADTPEAKALAFAQANAKVIAKMGGDVEKFYQWYEKYLKAQDRQERPATAG